MEAGRPLFIPVILGTARMGRMSLTQLSLSPGNWASAQALRPTSSKSRGISLTPLTRSVEFRRELRLEAAACLFELGFSPCHVSQQCVQLLWTQNQQSEHKHEQDFGTQTHDSPLGQALVVGNGGCCAGRLLFIFNSYLEAADALSNSFAKFRKLFGPEHEQGNSENNQQMHGLKQSFKHTCSLDRVRTSQNVSGKMQALQPVTRYSARPNSKGELATIKSRVGPHRPRQPAG